MTNDDVLLVPVTAVSKKGTDNYVWLYDDETQKIKQVRVKLGNADAKQQKNCIRAERSSKKLLPRLKNPLRMERH